MTGRWIEAIARRLLRPDTCAAIAVPAIADMQFEARSQSGTSLVRSYAGVVRALARAVVHDLFADVACAFRRESFRSAWLPAIAAYAGLVGLFCYQALGRGVVVHHVGRTERLPLPSADDGLWPYAAGVVVGIGLLCAGYAAAVLVFRLCRSHNRRTAAVAALILTAVTLCAARLARPIVETRDIYWSAIAMRSHADPQSQPLSEMIAKHVIPQLALRISFGGRDTTVAAEQAQLRMLREAQLTVNVLAFALVGFTLAGVRGRTLLARAMCLVAVWVILDRSLPIFHMIVWPYGSPQPARAMATLPELFVVPLAACIALAVRPRRHRSDTPRLAHGA